MRLPVQAPMLLARRRALARLPPPAASTLACSSEGCSRQPAGSASTAPGGSPFSTLSLRAAASQGRRQSSSRPRQRRTHTSILPGYGTPRRPASTSPRTSCAGAAGLPRAPGPPSSLQSASLHSFLHLLACTDCTLLPLLLGADCVCVSLGVHGLASWPFYVSFIGPRVPQFCRYAPHLTFTLTGV